MIGRLAREPLLHFLLVGALFFIVFGRSGPQPTVGGTEIIVNAADIERIAAGFGTTWQRPPSQVELQGAIDDYVREQVLYRTGLSLGLDKDDTIVRRRMRQKMEFLLEDTVGEPDAAELRAFFDSNADEFRSEPRISFRQVFLSSKRSDPKADAEAMLPRLVASGANAQEDGDPLLLPASFGPTSLSQVDSQFGQDFARDLSAVEPGHWVGPIKSPYGFHLVFVTEIEPAQLPPFEEVRDKVQREWFASRRTAVLEEEYEKLRSRFNVRVGGEASGPATQ